MNGEIKIRCTAEIDQRTGRVASVQFETLPVKEEAKTRWSVFCTKVPGCQPHWFMQLGPDGAECQKWYIGTAFDDDLAEQLEVALNNR